MLAALTTLEMAVGRSGRAKDAVPVRYTPRADDGFFNVLAEIDERELRVAVGIASCATWPAEGPARTVRQLLLPIDPAGSGGGSQARWRDAPLVPGFGARPLTDALSDVLIWRSRTAADDHNANNFRGVPTFPSGISVPAADLHALAGDELDTAKLDLYLRACLALNWRTVRWTWTAAKPDVPVTTLALLHPLAAGFRQGNPRDVPDNDRFPALAPEWATRLASGQPSQVQTVHREAAARLRQASGWISVPEPPDYAIPDRVGIRIAAALVPRCLNPRAVLRMIAFDPTADPDTTQGSDANPPSKQSEEL
jgi:CRISPR-associated protein Csx17